MSQVPASKLTKAECTIAFTMPPVFFVGILCVWLNYDYVEQVGVILLLATILLIFVFVLLQLKKAEHFLFKLALFGPAFLASSLIFMILLWPSDLPYIIGWFGLAITNLATIIWASLNFKSLWKEEKTGLIYLYFFVVFVAGLQLNFLLHLDIFRMHVWPNHLISALYLALAAALLARSENTTLRPWVLVTVVPTLISTIMAVFKLFLI